MSNYQTSSLRIGVARNFEGGGGIISTLFSNVFFFFGKTNLKLIETQKRLWGEGSGGMLPRKFLKIDML